ncbi:hypothetical protein DES44_3920 [Roseateles depolymerans]|uniref:Uncharacterized protein n=1 Tax=Roseateles depolymerans TaxID=76731 RepID=A0A0U3N1I8_9BURK|nr:hypothetical protein RD2015_4716 [Roseateles depolymerans]REG13911.1 hypothetical protein DES44_3920 [Roseateles depolymerans]
MRPPSFLPLPRLPSLMARLRRCGLIPRGLDGIVLADAGVGRQGGAAGRGTAVMPLAVFMPLTAVTAVTAITMTLTALPVHAQDKSTTIGGIYTCVTQDGRKLTSDRPIPECASREQRLLNTDGSTRRMVPPAMSPEEQAAAEARKRQLDNEKALQQDAIRRDRNLLQRYKDEAAHQRAREAALDDIRKAMQLSEQRLKDLSAERKPLMEETEFYKGKRLPFKLQHQLDTNEAAAAAQRESIENQRAEIVRLNRIFDDELARLRRMWAGQPPGMPDKPVATKVAPTVPPSGPASR